MIKGEKWVMGGKEFRHLFFFFLEKSPEYTYALNYISYATTIIVSLWFT
jgi:hypothetical protein